ncbi:PREDICTED: protein DETOXIFICATION 29-like [Ipomoea nil]|uniref:protein DETOXIFICATION 29-like n=1 Tax=Ipomoea nil TaxID=35883 RepID=UPI0009013583|nr:PREDICTED: protein DETOXIFICATION 29-like [Ipomoea nil]
MHYISDIQQIHADISDIQQIEDTSDIQQIEDISDIQQIENVKDFFKEFNSESKKLWYLAAPAICTLVFQYSISAITQVFAGHVGDIQLAAVSVENNLIAGFAFGILYGMGSALETLCGQAVGAKKLDMLGIYMQRSWIILAVTVIPLTSVYILTTPILKLLRQNPQIAKAAGRFTLWMIPELFTYVIIFPVQKFLQSQSKIIVMASITVVASVGHVVFSWLFMLKLHWGLPGAAVVLNATWLFIMVAQLVYIFSGACGDAWNGFSRKAFGNLRSFARLSLASGVMLCLEMWYFVALILISGYTKNAEISVDATSICINILQWTIMVGIGFNAAISVRVSNELGAGHPRTAKFSVVVATTTSVFIGIILGLIPVFLRSHYPPLFTKSSSVQQLVYDLTPLLGFTITLNSLQPTLSGVAIGAGWQSHVAYVNIVCYYFVGIPIGLLLGFVFNKGLKGIWYGMVTGNVVQTIAVIVMVLRTDWNKEALLSGDRIKKLGGDSEPQPV